jgi:hypothetical protein
MPIPSPIAQKTKFMSIYELKALQMDPSEGKAVKAVLNDFICEDQARELIHRLVADLKSPATQCEFHSGTDTYYISCPGGEIKTNADTFSITGPSVVFRQESDGQVRLTASGPVCGVSIKADPVNEQAFVSIDIKDAQVDSGQTATSASLSRKFAIPLPPDIAAYKNRTVNQYRGGSIRNPRQLNKLLFAYTDLLNHIVSELNGRAAFVVSCLLLVLVGSSLGMMFRSGNFLTAFAVSVIPALLSTVLIVTGQHTVEATPTDVLQQTSSVALGISVIWSGNLIIGISAFVLLWRLQRR